MRNYLYSVSTFFITFTLLFAFVMPSYLLAEPVPANSVFSQNQSKKSIAGNALLESSTVYFEQNNGQFNSKVKYFARGTNGYSLFLTATEAVYVLTSPRLKNQISRSNFDGLKERLQNSEPIPQSQTKAVAVYMKLIGANETSNSVGVEQLPHKTNYFKGKKANWHTKIPNFKQIRMNDVYQGIDTVWKGKANGSVQYDFIVKPNADPNLIEWEVEGAKSVEIDENGDLLIGSEYGTVRQQKPFTYQANNSGFKEEIESQFKIITNNDNSDDSQKFRIKFEVGNYDRSKTLIIDPSVDLSIISGSTYFGGNGSDEPSSIAVDRAGNVYITGLTTSILFPTTPGTFDRSANGNNDAFVAKLNASLKSLIFSTYIGGSDNDNSVDIKVDGSENIYIGGFTTDSATDFPTTNGAFDETHNGDEDAFITKLNPDGSSLIYSTLLGGALNDSVFGLDINSLGEVYATGLAGSSGFPTTVGAFDETFNGGNDAFVSKLSADGSALVYSTYIGGSNTSSTTETGLDIAVDSGGNANIVGLTVENDFPRTFNAFDTTYNGNGDAFVTRFNASGTGVIYSTYLGGSNLDQLQGIDVDPNGNAYVTGTTNSTDYPTTTGSFDETANGDLDAVITKIDLSGEILNFSTYIGGSGADTANDIVVDEFGFSHITGRTFETAMDQFPQTGGSTVYGDNDVFITKLNSAGNGLTFSNLIGSQVSDSGEGIALDRVGNILFTSNVQQDLSGGQYPVYLDAYQNQHNGGFADATITKYGDFSITGRTIDSSGNALENTAVQLSGFRSDFMLTDSQGYFGFLDTVSDDSTVTFYGLSASKTLYNFNPNSYEIPDLDYPLEYNFVGLPTSSGPTASYASVGGNVRSTVGNIGLANARLTLIDAVSGETSVVNSDANGNYEFEGLLTGSFYLVVPEKEGYNFNPGIYQVNHLNESLGNDFLATPNSPRPVNDFDGDGKTDLAIFRPEEGNWYILESESNNVRILRFGLDGDVPVASDFDGDAKTDIAVYRPTEGNWYRINSSNGEFEAIHFGTAEDKPVQADFDGDGKTDLAVYRPSTGVWHRLMSTDGSYSATKFGIKTDIPIAADYDSDGKADLTVYRDGTWYHQNSSDNEVRIYQFGLAGDKPIRADFDGDGRIDTALYRPSSGVWYWIKSSDNDIQAKQFGIATDIPTASDYNGDGRYEPAVYRDGVWYVLRSNSSFYVTNFGLDEDIPIP